MPDEVRLAKRVKHLMSDKMESHLDGNRNDNEEDNTEAVDEDGGNGDGGDGDGDDDDDDDDDDDGNEDDGGEFARPNTRDTDVPVLENVPALSRAPTASFASSASSSTSNTPAANAARSRTATLMQAGSRSRRSSPGQSDLVQLQIAQMEQNRLQQEQSRLLYEQERRDKEEDRREAERRNQERMQREDDRQHRLLETLTATISGVAKAFFELQASKQSTLARYGYRDEIASWYSRTFSTDGTTAAKSDRDW